MFLLQGAAGNSRQAIIFYTFATIVANEYGYTPHFCNLIQKCPYSTN